MKLFATTLLCFSLTVACSKDNTDNPDETGDSQITGTDSGPPTTFLVDDSIELIRDDKGVPHIYAKTQRGVYFGLGYASAQDRMFQMDFVRRKTGGSLAEFFWEAGETDFNQELQDGDVMVRTLGLRQHAERVVEGLPEDKRLILTSFTDGVNTYIKSIDQMPLLYKLKGKSEIALWTEADSILAWDYAWLYQGNPQREIVNEIKAWDVCSDPTDTECVPTCQRPLDDASAIVPEEASVNWPDRKRNSTLPLAEASTTTPFKEMSHGWAVSGDHITTGKPVLAFDPKIPVWAPSLFYPFHLSGPDLEVRGMGFPGAPALLTFWNENLGQTVTSTQGDMIDLFAMTAGSDTDHYMLDGVEQAYKLREEIVPLGDGTTYTFTVKESVWGPVINNIPEIISLTRGVLEDSATPMFSAKNVEQTRVDTHSVIAAMEANESNTLEEYRNAHGNWFTPYTHTIYAGVDAGEEESDGHIAYHHTSGVPWRVSQEIGGLDYTGQHPQDGSVSQNDWTGLMTIDERPHVIDPSSGYIMAANHLTIGSWYQDFAYTGTTSATGETFRSLILRDLIETLLSSADTVAAKDVHLIHESNTSYVTKSMQTTLAYIIDDLGLWGQAPTSGQAVTTDEEKAHKLREALDAYAATGMNFVESNPYEDLVRAVTQSMKSASYSLSDDFKCTWNNGTTAANWIARTLNADTGQALTDHPELIEFILKAAAGAYDWIPPQETDPIWQGDDLSTWTEDEPLAFDIAFGYFGSQCSVPTSVTQPSDAECSLSQDYVIHYDSLERRNKNLISSASDSSMPATVDFSDVDAAQWLFPVGVSEDPLSDDFDSFLGEWENYSQSGDSTQSYVDAPLDRDLITIRDNTPLSYWEG